MWTQVPFALLQCMRLTDRQTHRRTERPSEYRAARALRYMQSHGKNRPYRNSNRQLVSLSNFYRW